MNVANFTLDSGRKINVQKVIRNDDELQDLLAILDSVMIDEDETTHNQSIVEFIFKVINHYEDPALQPQ